LFYLDNGKKVIGERSPTNAPYYSSYVEGKWEFDGENGNSKDALFPPTARITFIVGLPCSGKTTFAHTVFVDANHEIHDDILHNTNITELAQSLDQGKHLVLIDPRFCLQDSFEKFMTTMFGGWTCPVPVDTILVISTAEECIANWNVSQELRESKPTLDTEIQQISERSRFPRYDFYPNITLLEGYCVSRRL
jgi:hypothetical protein